MAAAHFEGHQSFGDIKARRHLRHEFRGQGEVREGPGRSRIVILEKVGQHRGLKRPPKKEKAAAVLVQASGRASRAILPRAAGEINRWLAVPSQQESYSSAFESVRFLPIENAECGRSALA